LTEKGKFAMATIEHFEHVFFGCGKGGKTLAMELAQEGRKAAVIDRGVIGGSCIKVACIPGKTSTQTARTEHIPHQQDGASAIMANVSSRIKAVVDGAVEINRNAFRDFGLELVQGWG
jgi:pyruvate/2-oxoglutarate dehydrogenase complex dihydrolipoamide dehydrogenase (E3) component